MQTINKAMKILFSFLVIGFLAGQLFDCYAQNRYRINIDEPEKEIIEGHLNLGGVNPNGDSLSVNNYYFELNGRPYFPINGEFHYARYPNEYWEEAIRKLKAGGINMIATYVFWNMHEPYPRQFDWEEDLNLRKFVELCKKHEMTVILRIGPFAHAALRNGGLPDWLYGRPFNVRSNDPEYLTYVEEFYNEIGAQVNNLFFKDGGPIIGIQLENEYQHASAQWAWKYPDSPREPTVAMHDRDYTREGMGINEAENKYAEYGEDHMKTLKKLAIKAGMEAPIYTATGWGNASIIPDETIPVTAAYPYPSWAPPRPSTFYLYKDIHAEPDYSPVSYQSERYPSFPAEIGASVMEGYDRRPFVPQESLAPLIVRTLGSGSNGIGYYTYHGGSTPFMHGRFYSDMAKNKPRISHEQQSPVGEFGELLYGYYDLKLIHYFLNSFGEELAPTTTYLPEGNDKITPEDVSTLRYSVRARGNSGFIFMHNFQDHLALNDLKDLQLTIETGTEEINIPESSTFTLRKEAWAILPFNLNLDGIELKYSTTQPLTKLKEGLKNKYVFYSTEGFVPEFAFVSDVIEDVKVNNSKISKEKGITYIRGKKDAIFSFNITANGTQHEFLVVPKEMALNAWLTSQGGEQRVIFSPATIWEKDDSFELISQRGEEVPLYMYGLSKNIEAKGAEVTPIHSPHPKLSAYKISFDKIKPPVEFRQATNQHWVLNLTEENLSSLDNESLNDIFISIDYEGDMVQAFIDGRMIGDDLYLGKPWIIGLKRFIEELKSEQMYFYFRPLYPNAPFYNDFSEDMIPDFSDKKEHLKINNIEIIPEYKTHFTIQNN